MHEEDKFLTQTKSSYKKPLSKLVAENYNSN